MTTLSIRRTTIPQKGQCYKRSRHPSGYMIISSQVENCQQLHQKFPSRTFGKFPRSPAVRSALASANAFPPAGRSKVAFRRCGVSTSGATQATGPVGQLDQLGQLGQLTSICQRYQCSFASSLDSTPPKCTKSKELKRWC